MKEAEETVYRRIRKTTAKKRYIYLSVCLSVRRIIKTWLTIEEYLWIIGEFY